MHRSIYILPLIVFILLLTTLAHAEFAVDLYGGLAKTQDSDLELEVSDVPFGPGPISLTENIKTDLKFKNSFIAGARVAYWFQRLPWLGIALDASYFEANAKNANVEIPVGGFSLLLMMRYPLLVNEEFPQGRLQPYLGVGPEVAFSKFKAEFESNGSKTKIEKKEAGEGVDVRAGMLWQFRQHWGIFTEYRFTYLSYGKGTPFRLNHEDREGTFEVENLKTNLTTQHFLMGVSFRF